MDKCAAVVLNCSTLDASEYAACLDAAKAGASQDNSRFVIGVVCTIISSVGR
jgi:hypothetical protein